MRGLNLGTLWVNLTARTEKWFRDLRKAESGLKTFSKNAAAMGAKMSMAVTLPLTIMGGTAVKAFGDFDSAMTQSTAIMGNVSSEMRRHMEDTARTVSTQSITSSTELAESYFFLASAGLDAAQATDALATVNQFAVAGMFDMSQATTLLADAQAALGLKTADAVQNTENMVRISDVLVRANTLANASVEQFSRALTTKSAAAIRLLNKDVEEGVAVLAAFADQGIKGEAAGEKLHIVLRDLQRATLKSSKEWERLGLQLYDAEGTMLPLADIIGQLERHFMSLTDREKKATAELLGFQDRSFSALQTLFGTSKKIKEFEKELRSAGGFTEDVANKQLASFNSQMKIMRNNMNLASQEVGRILAPAVLKLSEYVKDATQWFRGLDESSKRWIVGLGVAAAAIGPLLTGLGAITAMASKLIAVLTGAVSLGAVAAVGAFVLWAAACWLVIEALDGVEGGLLDLINNARVSGLKITTWFQLASLEILKAWSWMVTATIQAWETLKFYALNIGTRIWRFFLEVAAGIQMAFWDAVKGAAKAFSSLVAEVRKNRILRKLMDLGDQLFQPAGGKQLTMFERLEKRAAAAASNSAEAFSKAMEKSLNDTEERASSYYDKMADLDRQHADNVAAYEDARTAVIDADASAANVAKSMEDAAKATEKMAAEAEGEMEKVGGGFKTGGEFRQMSSRQFTFGGTAATPAKKTEEVEDKTVAGKLDEVIFILSGRERDPALLGR